MLPEPGFFGTRAPAGNERRARRSRGAAGGAPVPRPLGGCWSGRVPRRGYVPCVDAVMAVASANQ